MKQRILVLGASGFIGRRLFRALATSDWASPVAGSRRTMDSPGRGMDEPSSIRVDATNPGQVERALKGISGVVNCVAGNPETIVNSARALFAAAASQPIAPTIVHLSSMAIYGSTTGDVDESASSSRERSAYGEAKYRAEQFAASYPNSVVLRPGIVYGPESSQWSARIAQMLFARRLGDLGAGGDGYCNLVYVDDLVQAIIQSLRDPGVRGRTFNLSLPHPPTWNEYFMLYAQALGAVPVKRIGARRLKIEAKVLAPPLKIAELLAGRIAPRLAPRIPQAIPNSLVGLFRQEIKLNASAATHDLDLRWTPLNDGLARTAAWYRASA